MKYIFIHVLVALFALWFALTFLSKLPIILGLVIVCIGACTSFYAGRKSANQYRHRAAAYSVTVFILGFLVGIASGSSIWGLAGLVTISAGSYLMCYIAGSIGGRKQPTQVKPN